MSFYVVDIESDGPCPGKYSMIAIGAVKVTPDLDNDFLGYLRPISEHYDPKALAISGFRRETTLVFPDPKETMCKFVYWVNMTSKGKPIFVSDNNGFDWMFACYYMWTYAQKNPFGFSSRNINDLYKGTTKDFFASWKHLRTEKHDHNPVNDARGNAGALMRIVEDHGLSGFKFI
jgi:hypothetical protein